MMDSDTAKFLEKLDLPTGLVEVPHLALGQSLELEWVR